MIQTPAPPSLVNHTNGPTVNNDLRPPNHFFVDATRYLLVTKARRHFYAHFMINDVTGQSLEYRHLSRGTNTDVCSHSLANNLVRLAQGVGTRIPIIRKCNVPAGRTVTHSRLVSIICPHKTKTHRVCVTVGGDKLDFQKLPPQPAPASRQDHPPVQSLRPGLKRLVLYGNLQRNVRPETGRAHCE